MRIKSIYIDGLHNADKKTYEFNQITYLHGRNGAGKSTVLQAIQFVLLGYIPGTAKTKVAKLRHGKNSKLHAKLTLVDDAGNDIVLERILTDTLDIFNTIPENFDVASVINELELPIFDFNEFVGQTANKLKEYFIQNILSVNNGDIDWPVILGDAIKDLHLDNHQDILDTAIKTVSTCGGDPLQQALSANLWFKEVQKSCNNSLKSIQGAIDSLIFYDDYTGPTNIAAIEDQIQELSLLKDSVIAYQSAELQSRAIQNKLASATKTLEDLNAKGGIEIFKANAKSALAERDDFNNQIHDYEAKIAELEAKCADISDIVKGKGVCPYTKETCQSVLDKIETSLKAEYLALTRQAEEYRFDLDRCKVNHFMADRNYTDAINDINKWNDLTAQIDGLKSMVSSLPTKPNTDKTDIELAQEIKVLQDNKMKAFANQQYNVTIDELTKKKFQAELELAAFKAWVKVTDANGLQTQLMDQPFNELADKMTGYIQTMYGRDDIKAHFNVEAKANSFSFGLIRDDKYIPYDLLSSGEKCLYTLALMICIIDNNKSPLKVVLLDDALDNLDDIAIENTFKALKNIQDIQFILAGVKHSDNAEDVVVEVG